MPAAMAMMPAASPSSPSMMLMALAMPSTQITLSRYDQFGSRMNVPTNGMRSDSRLMPENTSTLADSTMPATLAGGDTSRRSSMAPTASMSTAAITRPSGSVLLSKIESKACMRQATSMPTRKPTSMAAAAQRRRRSLVHPALVGLHHRPDPHRDATHQRDGRERHHGDDDQHHRVGAERGHDLRHPEPVGWRDLRSRVGRELGAEGDDLVADRRQLGVVGAGRAGPGRSARRSCAISASVMPWVVTDAVPMRRPLVTNGLRGSSGMVLRFSVMPARSSTVWASLPVSSASNERRSTSMRWLSVPPDTRRKPSPARAAASASALRDDLGRVGGERRVGGLAERHRLGRDDVLERAALQAGEHGLVDGRTELGPAQDAAAPRAAQRLVGGEGDDVGVGHRVRVHATGDEPGDVGGVEHEQRADLVGDLAQRRRAR